MTARERAELASLVSRSTTLLRAALFLLAVGLVGLAVRTVQGALLPAGGAVIGSLWLAVPVALGALLYRRGARWTGGRAFRRRVRRDLDRGEIALRRIHVVEALEAPEVEDEGPVFFVRDSDGDTLFFAGQELSRHKARGFPWTDFEISEAPESGHFFRLEPLGGPFDPVPTRAPLEYAEGRDLGVFSASYGTLDVTLDELRRRPRGGIG